MKLLSFLLATALALPSLRAQEEMIRTELLTLSINGLLAPGLFYRNGKEVHELTAIDNGMSAPIFYSGTRRLNLYRTEAEASPAEDPAKAPKPALSITLPKNSDRVLLVFAFPDKKAKLPGVKAYGIDDSSLREGDYRVFNFSRQKVYVMLEDKKNAISVDPGKVRELKPKGWRSKLRSIQTTVGARIGKDIRPVYQSVWEHRPERRNFLIVFDNPDKIRPLRLSKFYDVPGYKTEGRVRASQAAADL